MDMRLGRQRSTRGRPLIVIAALIAVAVLLLWLFRLGTAPEISLATDNPALGAATRVLARFTARGPGLTSIRLELQQGDRTVLLAEQHFPAAGLFGSGTQSAELAANAGYKPQPWLAGGEALLRASAERTTGPLRRARWAVTERRVAVRREPPRLELLSADTRPPGRHRCCRLPHRRDRHALRRARGRRRVDLVSGAGQRGR
jgi:hypothetical protein